jgi:hypothetical protein
MDGWRRELPSGVVAASKKATKTNNLTCAKALMLGNNGAHVGPALLFVPAGSAVPFFSFFFQQIIIFNTLIPFGITILSLLL